MAKIVAGTSAHIGGTIRDHNIDPTTGLGAAIQPATLVYTHYAVKGDDLILIGSVDVSLTPGTDAPSGVLDFVMGPSIMVMQDSAHTSEVHHFRFKFTYGSGDVGIDYYTFDLVKDEAPTS